MVNVKNDNLNIAEKEYFAWNSQKIELSKRATLPFFSAREIWWCNLGKNIGFEENGKGDDFRRPVLIVRKFNRYLFLALPLTSVCKINKFHYKLPKYRNDGKDSFVILSQVKVVSANRLIRKIYQVGDGVVQNINEQLFGLIAEKAISPDRSGESRTANAGLYPKYSKSISKSQEVKK
jgi:mRNA interferase MazF